MQLIDRHDARWQTIGDADAAEPNPTPRPHALLTLEQWHSVRAQWPAALPVGVIVPNTADVTDLQPDLPRLQLLQLQFPKWTDGRAYSQARLLRSRLLYAGELRAAGEVLVDMMPLLQRCGFDSAQLRDGQDPDTARRTLGLIAEHYQADAQQWLPLFQRKVA